MSLSRTLLPLAIFLIAACATAPPNLNDGMIVPGKRMGAVELGMPLATLLALKGAPLRTAPIPNTTATTYTFQDGLTVGAEETVYWIITEDPAFRTDTGVGPGVEQIFARAQMGKPRCVETRSETTMYDYGNVYFEAGNVDGHVKRLGVISHERPCAQPG